MEPRLDGRRIAGMAGQNHHVTIEIAHPQLSLTGVGVDVYVVHEGWVQRLRPRGRLIEVIDLEPDQHSMADRSPRVLMLTMMVIDIGGVQLQHQKPVSLDPVVLLATVHARRTEHLLIPTATCFDISHIDEVLWLDSLNGHDCHLARWGRGRLGRFGGAMATCPTRAVSAV